MNEDAKLVKLLQRQLREREHFDAKLIALTSSALDAAEKELQNVHDQVAGIIENLTKPSVKSKRPASKAPHKRRAPRPM
jgi:Na+/phosphate symporter